MLPCHHASSCRLSAVLPKDEMSLAPREIAELDEWFSHRREISRHKDRQRVMGERKDVLPVSLAPRGLSRVQAAAYVGVSPSLFDEMVKDGRMPRPTRINSRAVWDRVKLDEAFAALPDDGAENATNSWADFT
jgi:predicted DNA-binding transcriptional regulator AlpA